MREIFTYGSVGGALGNQCFYPEGVEKDLLLMPAVDARSVLARIAVRNNGYKGAEVAKALSLSPPSVSRLVENGEKILDNQKHVSVKMTDMEL